MINVRVFSRLLILFVLVDFSTNAVIPIHLGAPSLGIGPGLLAVQQGMRGLL
jgi:hypothetical protein